MGTRKMDSAAVYQRDKKLIREIRQKEEEYEREVQKAAEEIERKQLKMQSKQ